MSDKSEKSNKLKARLPRGLRDRTPGEIAATRVMIEKIRAVYELYGFEPVETPAIEFTDALGKFLPDQDRPNEGVFSFQDDDEQWLSLRYDLTAPLARYVAENFDTLPKPYRSYRVGHVYRNEKPGPGRFRQFMQFDADTVGSSSPAADAEMCMMAADAMEALGIPRGSYVVKVNNRKVFDGLLESIDLGGEAHSTKRLIVLRAIDKLDRLGLSGVCELLGRGRWDGGEEGKGDFTKGADLNDYQQDAIIDYISTDANVRERWETPTYHRDKDGYLAQNYRMYLDMIKLPQGHNPTSSAGIDELRAISDLVEKAGYKDRIEISKSVVRGLEYYTGPVFEVELLFGKDGSRFGSVGGGGRYDGLVSRFRGEPVPATGFSVGVSRLLAALDHLGKIGTKAEMGPVVVGVFSDSNPGIAKANLLRAHQMAHDLRQAKIRAEVYLGNPKNIGGQFKYADRRNSPCFVVQGADEKNHPAGPQVTIKDLIVGAELAKLEKGRDEYLQKQAEAQRAVPEANLVEAVRDVLARHGLMPR